MLETLLGKYALEVVFGLISAGALWFCKCLWAKNKELEKLQTLPIGYVNDVDISQTAKEKAIGNGWTVDVIAHIFTQLKAVKANDVD